ncbi:hypothetical protein BJ878DRAFT_562058 [Calycina marina]|uniref:Uncharacterized protein n=1 Tax=Calycina marina TaxID=1763456 RepID=A0A9P7Z742_9HELO|nr:hypothetical protein BJ878DRAFT_562058 [Calycina marina]
MSDYISTHKQPWADTPIPLIVTPMFPNQQDAAKANFIRFCLAWHKLVEAYANYKKTKLCVVMVDSYKPDLDDFHTYLTTLPTTTDLFGTHPLTLLTTLQPSFTTQLKHEITTLAHLAYHASFPSIDHFTANATESDIEAIEALEAVALQKAGMTDVRPFFLFNFKAEYGDGAW